MVQMVSDHTSKKSLFPSRGDGFGCNADHLYMRSLAPPSIGRENIYAHIPGLIFFLVPLGLSGENLC